MIAVLRRLCVRNYDAKVSVGRIAQALGSKSFASVILAVGLIAVTPIDSIPTLPTTFGAIILLTVGQMLIGRRSLWLPRIIADRGLDARRLEAALIKLQPYACWADRWIRTRLSFLTDGGFVFAIAMCCAALMPVLELLPLVSTIPSVGFHGVGDRFAGT